MSRGLTLSHMLLTGYYGRWYTTSLCESAYLIFISLRPEVVGQLFGLGPNDLNNQSHDVEALWGPDVPVLIDQLRGELDPARQVLRVMGAIRKRVQGMPAIRADMRVARDALHSFGGGNAIGRLSETLGMSPRNLNAVFQRHACVAPKKLARLARFHRAALALQPRAGEPAQLVHAEDYCDDAHWIHDFSALSGMTPRQFAAAFNKENMTYNVRVRG
ncbi:MAG: AraC family transcriptional regulator [Betaproteobacteria bacterium]|nr:AraC family transcriptional regulator [Betaproteobacteria bacterium]